MSSLKWIYLPLPAYRNTERRTDSDSRFPGTHSLSLPAPDRLLRPMQRLERHASLYGELAKDIKARDSGSIVESIHERAPLLRRISTLPPPRLGATPLPQRQLSIILFLQLSEPITSQCIYPFIVEVCALSSRFLPRHIEHCLTSSASQLIRSLDITNSDTRKVGYYAGMIVSIILKTVHHHTHFCL